LVLELQGLKALGDEISRKLWIQEGGTTGAFGHKDVMRRRDVLGVRYTGSRMHGAGRDNNNIVIMVMQQNGHRIATPAS